jgi:type I restriction enzyme M protein
MDRQTLSNKIKRACDIMRQKGKLIPLQYLEQLSWLLFLKLFNENEEKKRLLNPDYQPIFDAKYRWKNWAGKFTGAELLSFVEQKLIPYLTNLTGTPQKEKIGAIFSEIRNYMKSGYALAELIELIDEIDFSSTEDTQVLSMVYEELLMRTAGEKGGGAGEFYTPRPIVRFMIKIIEPKVGERILDPFCGSGGFLVESFKILNEKAKTLREHKVLQEETFYGQEAKAFPYLVGMMNCMLHGIEAPNIVFLKEEGGTFAEDIRSIPESKRVEVILTNPPFGGEEDKKALSNFPLKTSDTELAGLYYCMRKLKVGGRCGIVQPEGVLFKSLTQKGNLNAYGRVKKELLENYNLHTIISLPHGVFANVAPKPGPGPKTNLLFFEKGKPTKEIWYYEVNPPPGMKNYTKTKPITDEDLKDVFEKWQKREISENSWIVRVDEIIKRDYDLSAKNPNKIKGPIYRKPEELVKSVLKQEKAIEGILAKIKKITR